MSEKTIFKKNLFTSSLYNFYNRNSKQKSLPRFDTIGNAPCSVSFAKAKPHSMLYSLQKLEKIH